MGWFTILLFAQVTIGAINGLFVDVCSQDTVEKRLGVFYSVSFARSDISGVKLVSGQPTEATISITNYESFSIIIKQIGYLLTDIDNENIIVEIKGAGYNNEIPAYKTESLKYVFMTEMPPMDLRLCLAISVQDSGGVHRSGLVYKSNVSVVKSEINRWDLDRTSSAFLYLFIVTCASGVMWRMMGWW